MDSDSDDSTSFDKDNNDDDDDDDDDEDDEEDAAAVDGQCAFAPVTKPVDPMEGNVAIGSGGMRCTMRVWARHF